MPTPTYATPELAAEARRIAHAGNWMHRIMLDYGANALAHRPDKRIIAEFLAVAPWPDLLQMLRTMHAQKTKPGHSYAWFVSVANQRINDVSPEESRARRAEQRSLARNKATREAGA